MIRKRESIFYSIFYIINSSSGLDQKWVILIFKITIFYTGVFTRCEEGSEKGRKNELFKLKFQCRNTCSTYISNFFKKKWTLTKHLPTYFFFQKRSIKIAYLWSETTRCIHSSCLSVCIVCNGYCNKLESHCDIAIYCNKNSIKQRTNNLYLEFLKKKEL